MTLGEMLHTQALRDPGVTITLIMPRVTTGNTMAPCAVIGERVAELLKGG